MFRKQDPLHNRIRRGAVLRLIYMAWQGEAMPPDHPMEISAQVLKITMDQLKMLPSDAELRVDLQYCASKEYLLVDWSRDGSGEFRSVRLLSKGVDLVEGSITDPGIILEARR